MITRHCEECWAVLDPTKVLRCTKCKACCYCSERCQKRNWKRIHKRVCTTDPSLRRFVPVEMAIERALLEQPKVQAPKDAFCYICLEGDDGGKLMRGCACRGDSAGFVHVECLAELAKSKEASGDLQTVFAGWRKCGNCKHQFTGALGLEMQRRFWRRHRSSQDPYLYNHSTTHLAHCIGANDEFDAANQLLDDASTFAANGEQLLVLKLLRVELLKKNGQQLEALALLQATLPAAKAYTANPLIYCLIMLQITDVLVALGRYQEAHEGAAKLVAFAKAKFGLENPTTMSAVTKYAFTCAKLGRVEEAKTNFEDVLTIQTRVLGREHPDTQTTIRSMQGRGIDVPSG